MDCRPDLLFTVARAEARRMKDTAAEAKLGQQIAISPAEFRKLAQLLEAVIEFKMPTVDPDSFDTVVDGFRFWMPLPQVKKAMEELIELRAAAQADFSATPTSKLWPFNEEDLREISPDDAVLDEQNRKVTVRRR